MKKFLGRFKYYLIGVLVVGVLFGVYYTFFAQKGNNQESLVVKKADFVQTVTIAGKVIPAQSVELGFNRGGKVSNVLVTEGQRVVEGQTIAQLDAREAELALNSARLDLNKMIESGQAGNFSGAVKNYEDSLVNINKTFFDTPDIINGLEDILVNYQLSLYKNNLPNDIARKNLEVATASFYKNIKIYKTTLAHYQGLRRPLPNDTIASLNEEVYSMLQGLSQMMKDAETYISYVYDISEVSGRTAEMSADRSQISAWLQTINSDLALVGGSRETLKVSTLDIEGQKLTVDQRANDYAQYFLRAPFSGLVTRVDIKTGEIVSAGKIGIMMINDDLFQIESYVPEVSIAGLKVGNPALVTLDAYGPEVFFDAKVVFIDPAETIRDGVSTYKIKLQFTAKDQRIRSGMTSNVVITSENKSQIISVPASAINVTASGEKFVQVKVSDSLIKRVVTPGLVGALGQTEILSGLKEGEVVVFDAQAK
ncbi:MAG: HlyD family efflux transporter periplasmic adaptor subunit [Candidatus Paceibacterota bacterium]|jgi:multidrug efflux pump subunit AcrA (membrane-fusion protein)